LPLKRIGTSAVDPTRVRVIVDLRTSPRGMDPDDRAATPSDDVFLAYDCGGRSLFSGVDAECLRDYVRSLPAAADVEPPADDRPTLHAGGEALLLPDKAGQGTG
jgi:hypothetical protein